jgi:hypothetical protein
MPGRARHIELDYFAPVGQRSARFEKILQNLSFFINLYVHLLPISILSQMTEGQAAGKAGYPLEAY